MISLPDDFNDRAAARRRHPTAAGPHPLALPPGSFAGAVERLCGPLRATDAEGCAQVLAYGPAIAGKAVVDLAHHPAPAAIVDGLLGACGDDTLQVTAVTGTSGYIRIVEGRAVLAPSAAGPGLLAVAHLRSVAGVDLAGSWLVVMVSDRAGGVGAVARLSPLVDAAPTSLRFSLRALTGLISGAAVAVEDGAEPRPDRRRTRRPWTADRRRRRSPEIVLLDIPSA